MEKLKITGMIAGCTELDQKERMFDLYSGAFDTADHLETKSNQTDSKQ